MLTGITTPEEVLVLVLVAVLVKYCLQQSLCWCFAQYFSQSR